jgi:hypothetical protein
VVINDEIIYAVAKDGLVMSGENAEELNAVMQVTGGYIAVGYTR